MTKFILLVGLPGSGKTYYGRRLGLPFLDDITQTQAMDTLWPSDSTVVLSDYGFIFEDVRMRAGYFLRGLNPNCDIEYRVWDNDPEQCWQNIEQRQDGRIISRESLFEAASRYIYPSSPNFLVYSPANQSIIQHA